MIAMRLKEEEERLIREYAKMQSRSVSDVVRSAILEKIEDEYDVRTADLAYQEYLDDPVTYSIDEVERSLGLSWAIGSNSRKGQTGNLGSSIALGRR
jgi:hypothetical protein